nr:MAG TPA: hypothetical protein [Caudoviricetes sp.]
MDPKKDKLVKELMNDAIVAMAKLKEVAPDYWRVVLIALTNEEKKDREEIVQVYNKKRKELDIRQRMIDQIHDAMFDLIRREEPISKESICSWVLMDDEVRDIISKMPVDQFNTIFAKMFAAITEEMEEG